MQSKEIKTLQPPLSFLFTADRGDDTAIIFGFTRPFGLPSADIRVRQLGQKEKSLQPLTHI